MSVDKSAVSPVISVVMVVFVTVALSFGVYLIVFDAAPSSDQASQTQPSISKFSTDQNRVTATVVQRGSPDEITYTLNGVPVYTVNNLSENVGNPIELSEHTQFCKGDTLAVITGPPSSGSVIQSSELTNDINCHIPNTTTTANATYDGSSWIISVSISNTGDKEQTYTVQLTDGDTYETADTVTLSPGESTTVPHETSTFSSDDPLQVGVLAPSNDTATSSYELSGGGLGDGEVSSTSYTGGPTASSFYYQPSSDSTTISEPSGSSGTVSSDSTDSDPLTLSTSRTGADDPIKLYAKLTTNESSTNETLVVYATRSNGGSVTQEVSRTTYTLREDEITTAIEEFSLGTSGEYVITASLAGSGTMYTVGTVTIVNNGAISFNSSSYTPESPITGDTITVSAELKNTESTDKSVTVEFYESGTEYSEKVVTVPASGTKTVSASISADESRLYQFHVGALEPAVVTHVGDVYVNEPTSVTISSDYTPTNPAPNADIDFDATASHSGGAAIVEYQWEFGNGVTRTTTAATTEYAYPDTGTYQYNVTAVAEDGESATSAGSLVVSTDGVVACDDAETTVFTSDTTLTAGTYEYTCLKVQAGVTLTVQGNATADANGQYGGVELLVQKHAVINGTINASEQGYGHTQGPGAGLQGVCPYGCSTSDDTGGGGGGYGGVGAGADLGEINDGGGEYGSNTTATRLGSGGGEGAKNDWESPGGRGGGSLWIQAGGDVVINGGIYADGERGYDKDTSHVGAGGGGSGGSIRISADVIEGPGTLTAIGGRGDKNGGYSDGGSGSGGRIYLEAASITGLSTDVTGPEYAENGTVIRNESG